MDKYEFQIKTEQLGKLLKKGDYKTAAKIADSIDWRKVRNVGLLLKVAEAYEKTERYEDCYEILNIAYDCAPIGRKIVYKMTEIAVKLKDFDEAVELYKEFVRIAPHDLGRYVLKYEIYKGRGSSLEDQIAILEEYKSREYQEEWAYELAELYYKAGMHSKCVEECDDLILWFSEGEFVMKAMELKMRIQPLTASQEQKYRHVDEHRTDLPETDLRDPEKAERKHQHKQDIPDVIGEHHRKCKADKSEQLRQPGQVVDEIVPVNVIKQLRLHCALSPSHNL